MTDKEKITKILKAYTKKHNIMASSVILEEYADELLANGVIVPPEVKDRYVMDTAKTLFESWNDVTGAVVKGTSWYYELESVIEDIVKLSFGAGVLYREQAEQKLKELNKGE